MDSLGLAVNLLTKAEILENMSGVNNRDRIQILRDVAEACKPDADLSEPLRYQVVPHPGEWGVEVVKANGDAEEISKFRNAADAMTFATLKNGMDKVADAEVEATLTPEETRELAEDFRKLSAAKQAYAFLKQSAFGGRIVCTIDLDETEVKAAKDRGHLFEDEATGWGFALVPWHLSTKNDWARDLSVSSAMVNRFLSWPLPASVCADLCATKRDYPHRTGTTLLTAAEARQMLSHVLKAEQR